MSCAAATRPRGISRTTVAIAFALTIAAMLFSTSRNARAEVVGCGLDICASPFSVVIGDATGAATMSGNGELLYDAETGEILGFDNVDGAINSQTGAAMWTMADGTIVHLDSLSGNADPILNFGFGVTNGSMAHSFTFSFSLPIALAGQIQADSDLGITLSRASGTGTVAPLLGPEILLARDNDVDLAFAPIDKGVDIGTGFSTTSATTFMHYADAGAITDPNVANIADYELMSVVLAFTLTPQTSVGMSGWVRQVVVPLPAALPLLLSGLAGVGCACSRRRKKIA